MLVEVTGCHIEENTTASGMTVYRVGDCPFPYSKGERISKSKATELRKEQREVISLIEEYADKKHIFENVGDYTAIFQLKRGTAKIKFENLETAVECAKYVSEHAKFFKGFVFVWKKHKWVYHLWQSEGEENYSENLTA